MRVVSAGRHWDSGALSVSRSCDHCTGARAHIAALAILRLRSTIALTMFLLWARLRLSIAILLLRLV